MTKLITLPTYVHDIDPLEKPKIVHKHKIQGRSRRWECSVLPIRR